MKHFTLPKEGGLLEENLPKGILHSCEKITAEILDDSIVASACIADIIVKAISDHKKADLSRPFKLGLTSEADVALYALLAQRYAEGRISFEQVEIFSIDEYYPCSKDSAQSRNRRLHEEFLDKVDVRKENVYIPDGTIPEEEVSDYCAEFEKNARGMDLLVINIGKGGQVGFNEAGTSEKSRTRTVLLSYQSRKRKARFFNGNLSDTPKAAITIGIDTMMSARRIILMAWGEDKAQAVKNIVEGKIDPACPASYLQRHDNISFYTDETSASLLTRIVSPWLVGPCDWTGKLVRKAVVWLCQKVNKPILKLTQNNYLENGLVELLEKYGPYDKINIDVFNDLQHTITGWPGGKPNADDSTRPLKSKPFPKKVLIFSPHPDDDIISMGGTFIRLTHQGHDVHVAYQTSGNVAVHDDVVLQQMDCIRERASATISMKFWTSSARKTRRAGAGKLLAIKAAIRRSEAGGRPGFGLPMDHIHFLNLPFTNLAA